MRTIGQVLDGSRGLGQGFDFLRVALALSVVTWHTEQIAHATTLEQNQHFLWFINYSVLEMFFGLSGFLITGSALRLGLRNFLINRGLRIFPALSVEIILSAFIIGPLLTHVPLNIYFTSSQTYHYLTNIFGFMNYYLPGVFTNHPSTMVNFSLWTVPFELLCYAVMSMMIISGGLRRPLVICACAAGITAVGVALFAGGFRGHPVGHVQGALNQLFYSGGSRLLVSFLLGVAAYCFRGKIPYSRVLFATCVIYIFIISGLGHGQYPTPIVSLITAIPLTYIMVFLGVSRLPRIPLFHRGDYSYGIYLYGWPVMQAMKSAFPTLGSGVLTLWIISVPVIAGCSAVSWHLIEKPILKARRKFSFVARQRLAESGPEPQLAGAEFDHAPFIPPK